MIVARSEAQCIVVAATEGWLLTHELGATAEFGLNSILSCN